MKVLASCFVLSLLLFSCDSSREDITTDEVSLDCRTISIVDSVGIEMGDSAYVFASIADIEILPNGNFIVLDATYCNMRIFDTQGQLLNTISNRGTGPGELANPIGLYNWGNGEVGVIDVYAGGIHRFSIDGEWLGLDLPITHNSFFSPIVSGEDMFVSFKSRFFQEGDALMATAFVALFPLSIEPEITYWEKTVPWDPAHMGDLANELLLNTFYTVDPVTGRVFVSPFDGDSYNIFCYEPDGTPRGVIAADYTPVPKTEVEIVAEKAFIEFFLRNGEGDNPDLNYDCTPWPNHLAVEDLFIGADGNLWVQRGGKETLEFDIWDESHELIGTARIPELATINSSWKLVFGEEYILAWNENPESYQQIYILK